MLDAHQSNGGRVAAWMVLPLLLLIAGCDFAPPETNSNGGGGGSGGSGTGGNASGSSSSGSSSSGSSSSSSSSSGSPMESCVNDIDDDENGSSDCADPACTGTHKCVVNGPEDPKWSKPFQAALLSFVNPTPSCAGGVEPIVYGLGPSPHICSQCKCDLPGALCTGAELTCYDGPNCGTIATTLVVDQPGCKAIIPGAYQGCKKTKSSSFDTANTQCTVLSGGENMVTNPFSQKLVRCDAPSNIGAGCGMGEHCEVKRNPEFVYACIAASGKQTCPAGWTAPNLTGYDTWSDTRSCAPCTCDIGAAVCLPSEFSGHGNIDCKPAASNLTSASCVPLTPTTASILYTQEAPFLQPSGCVTKPEGKLDYSGETTFCCHPAPP